MSRLLALGNETTFIVVPAFMSSDTGIEGYRGYATEAYRDAFGHNPTTPGTAGSCTPAIWKGVAIEAVYCYSSSSTTNTDMNICVPGTYTTAFMPAIRVQFGTGAVEYKTVNFDGAVVDRGYTRFTFQLSDFAWTNSTVGTPRFLTIIG